MKKEEMMLKATQMLAKGKFKLKKAGPTIMIVGAAISGVTAAVLACKATLKAEEIIAEHNAQIETIHTTKAQVDSGEMQLKDGETYTADDMKKDITATYVHTAVWLAKVYAPAVTLGGISLACMFGSHHIMSKRNASLTAAYIAIDKAFNEYKGRVTERFGDRVQRELEHNIKAVEVESTAKNEDGTEEVIREYTDVARDANDPYSMIFDESCSLWEKDSMLNAMTILLSDHFGESGEYISMRGFSYTPAPDRPLSVIWKKFVVRLDGEIIGYLFDDKCKYISAGSCARRKVAQVIRSPEQFFHPRCHFARQSKQIAFRLKKMGEDKLARLFDDDAALLLIINMWNLEIEDDDFSFVTQDMISPILEGKTND